MEKKAGLHHCMEKKASSHHCKEKKPAYITVRKKNPPYQPINFIKTLGSYTSYNRLRINTIMKPI